MGQLDGRVAVITAGSTGIGFGIARVFVDEGASVVLGNRSEASGARALERLDAGARAAFMATDATDREQVDRLVDHAGETFGGVDILVNCVGGAGDFAMIDSLSDRAFQQAFDLNCSSAFWSTRRALKYMLPKKFGRIINISSIEGKHANRPALSHYIVGKHALNGLTKATAREYALQGITCNAILPGPVMTEAMQTQGADLASQMGMSHEQFVEAFVAETLTKQLNTVEQVAGLALLLAGPLGSGMTGQLYNVDGGSLPY